MDIYFLFGIHARGEYVLGKSSICMSMIYTSIFIYEYICIDVVDDDFSKVHCAASQRKILYICNNI